MHPSPPREGWALLLDQDQSVSNGGMLVTLDKLANRMVSHRRCVIQISALSTVDGTLYAYHGCYG